MELLFFNKKLRVNLALSIIQCQTPAWRHKVGARTGWLAVTKVRMGE